MRITDYSLQPDPKFCMPALRNSVQLEHRLKQEGLGVMLVGEGGTAGEGGGASPSSCGILQLVGVLGWDRCVGQLRQRGWDGRSGGTRDRFGQQSARPPPFVAVSALNQRKKSQMTSNGSETC